LPDVDNSCGQQTESVEIGYFFNKNKSLLLVQ
jgi:hypothetical protein